jgi:hypothetical protein
MATTTIVKNVATKCTTRKSYASDGAGASIVLRKLYSIGEDRVLRRPQTSEGGRDALPEAIARIVDVREVINDGLNTYLYTLVLLDENGNLTASSDPNNVLVMRPRLVKQNTRPAPPREPVSLPVKSSSPNLGTLAASMHAMAATPGTAETAPKPVSVLSSPAGEERRWWTWWRK